MRLIPDALLLALRQPEELRNSQSTHKGIIFPQGAMPGKPFALPVEVRQQSLLLRGEIGLFRTNGLKLG